MKMKLTTSNIKTDEDYKTVLKTGMFFGVILMFLGIAAIIIAQLADTALGINLEGHQKSFISGIGGGLIAGGAFAAIRQFSILRNSAKVRKERIAITDERVQNLSGRALVASGLIMFVGVYVMAIVGGLFYPILSKVALILIGIFLVSYFVIYKILDARS